MVTVEHEYKKYFILTLLNLECNLKIGNSRQTPANILLFVSQLLSIAKCITVSIYSRCRIITKPQEDLLLMRGMFSFKFYTKLQVGVIKT